MAETVYTTQRLDHLGIVAGMCQEIELAGQIDRIVGPSERQVSVGEAVQAMVLNALGFVGCPLYLTPEFFADKPLERLLRPGLTPEMLNDDSLGRALDRLYQRGVTEVFAEVASHALRLYGFEHRFIHLDTTSFSAEEAVAAWAKRQRFHRAEAHYHEVAHYGRRGRPAAGETPQQVGWRVQGKVREWPEAIAAAEKGLGKFVLVTNERDDARLPAGEMLWAYKGQGVGPERGFRFLKDSWFFADSLFLKSPKRIMALVMVMGLALLVYALAEHKLRTALQEQGESVPNQLGKPTQRPTMRRVFQMFEGIDLLLVTTAEGVQQQVINLKPVHRQILRLLGPNVENCYLDTD